MKNKAVRHIIFYIGVIVTYFISNNYVEDNDQPIYYCLGLSTGYISYFFMQHIIKD